jgi:hypothetical protein
MIQKYSTRVVLPLTGIYEFLVRVHCHELFAKCDIEVIAIGHRRRAHIHGRDAHGKHDSQNSQILKIK